MEIFLEKIGKIFIYLVSAIISLGIFGGRIAPIDLVEMPAPTSTVENFTIEEPITEIIEIRESPGSPVVHETSTPAATEKEPAPAAVVSSDAASPPSLPAIIPAAPPPKIIAPLPAPLPAEKEINLKSVAVLVCHFKKEDGGEELIRGSGVIISPEGLILTARHLIEPVFNNSPALKNTSFDFCEVGFPPKDRPAFEIEDIKRINPFLEVTNKPYKARVGIRLPETGFSDLEKETFDLAILKISEAADNFVYAPLLFSIHPGKTDEALVFGYPVEASPGGGFFTHLLKGAVGKITDLWGGDKKFKNELLIFGVETETRGGFSGSPLFWRGYVVGIISSRSTNEPGAGAVSVSALNKILNENDIELNLPSLKN